MFALNLRAPFVSLAPIISDVAAGLGVSTEAVGLLTGIPVLCFALLAPFASLLLAKIGIEQAISIALLVVFAGTCIRSAGTFTAAVVGTIIIGSAITIGNVAVPVLISRDFPQSAGTVTGLYTAALNLGSVVATLTMAPLAALVGWQLALMAWTLIMAAAWFTWRKATAGHHRQPVRLATTDSDHTSPVWRRGVTWCLTLAFAGQSFSYYAVSTWLPGMLSDLQRMSASGAGGAASIFQLFGILGGVGVPLLATRGVPLRRILAGMSTLWLSLPIGLLVAPNLWPVWAACAGISQGGNFTVIFTLVVQHTRGHGEARRMSAVVQTIGYSAAALGPFALGAIHVSSGGWTVPLLVVVGALSIMTVSGLTAATVRLPVAGS